MPNASSVRWRQRNNGKKMVCEEEEKLRLDQLATEALLPDPGTIDRCNYGLIAELYQQLKKNYQEADKSISFIIE